MLPIIHLVEAILNYLIAGLLGLAVGSFLNVVIYRLPRRERIRTGRSACVHCRHPLKWYHNIPVVSYACLRGRCAFCGGRISPRYPAVELITAGLYLYLLWQFGLALESFIFAYIFSALVAIFFIDLEHQIIPDVITLPGIVLGVAVSLLPGGMSILSSLLGLVVGGGSLYLIALLGDWLFKKDSMGGGDIKLAAMLGAFLGWQKVLFVFVASAAIGLAVALVLMAFSRGLRRHRVIPFGPFLAVAAMLAAVWGDRIVGFYVDHFLGLP